jgi:hypothetical protein
LASYLRDSYLAAEALKGFKKGGEPDLLEELVVVDDNQDKEFLAAIKVCFARSGRDGGRSNNGGKGWGIGGIHCNRRRPTPGYFS